MEKIINPKTNNPYSQNELQMAYENGTSLPFILGTLPSGENLLGSHFVSKVWIDENGVSKEIYV